MKIPNIFKTKTGKIVIAQFPNRPMFLALAFYLLRFLDLNILTLISKWGVSIIMLYWSYLEVFHGVNTFRKILGIVVGIYFLSTLPIFV
ncbi:MAG: hypothetical protein ABFQ62_01010 [Patescibacteria group bacterium]